MLRANKNRYNLSRLNFFNVSPLNCTLICVFTVLQEKEPKRRYHEFQIKDLMEQSGRFLEVAMVDKQRINCSVLWSVDPLFVFFVSLMIRGWILEEKGIILLELKQDCCQIRIRNHLLNIGSRNIPIPSRGSIKHVGEGVKETWVFYGQADHKG